MRNCFEVDICHWGVGIIAAEFTVVSNCFEVDICQCRADIVAAGQEQINGRM